MIRLVSVVSIFNLFVAIYNISLVFLLSSPLNALGLLNLLIGGLGIIGWWKLAQKRKKLRQEAQLFEA